MKPKLVMVLCFAGLLSSGGCQYKNSEAPVDEDPYCDLGFSYPNAITVTGQAVYNIRAPLTSGCGLGAETYGGPIRRAEVQVIQGGRYVQCGHTDNEGYFSLKIPRNQFVQLRVNSRAQNAYVKASVLDAPTSNAYYSLKTEVNTFVSGDSKDVGLLSAPANGNLSGGAFNIYDGILKANESMRYLICGTSVDNTCTEFSVAPKVTAYWKPGFNPITYFNGDPSQGLSFYVLGTRKLYILGGISGNTSTADTDHFDNTIILHEYGHFIEDAFAKTDSPGGSHDGNHVLDARLVWSEGFANFYSSAVRADKKYKDTYGNTSGSTGCFFDYDLEKNQTSTGASLDVPTSTGEGGFREFAISRALWDGVDPIRNTATAETAGGDGGTPDDDATDSVSQASNNTFYKYWVNLVNNWSSTSNHFRSAGFFFELLNNATMSDILAAQKILNTRADYAKVLPTTGAGCNIAMAASDSSCILGGRLICQAGDRNACCSNQLKSNDFYYYYHDGTQTSLSVSQAATTLDLDLYLYKEGYTFGSDTTDAALSANSTSKNETISLAGLPVGAYLLNVSSKATSGNATYRISVSGSQVCP